MKEAIFHPEAWVEVRESLSSTTCASTALACGSWQRVEGTIQRILAHPEAGAPIAGGFRKRIVLGFPYSIIYRVWEDYVYLVAVAHHHHRRPGYWRERADRR